MRNLLKRVTEVVLPYLVRYKVYLAFVAGLLLLVASSLAVKSCYDNNVIKRHATEEQLRQEKSARKADAQASERRLEDTRVLDKIERDYSEAIDSAEPSAPSPSAVALNCKRLQRAGYDLSSIAACRGHQ